MSGVFLGANNSSPANGVNRDLRGAVLGDRYELVRHLGSGGMGDVYEARHRTLGRRFAIKILRVDRLTDRGLQRFEREAKAAGSIESEHVVAVIDFGVLADGIPYIVMEYLVGVTLGKLIRREGALAPSRASRLIEHAARGIAAAHAKGIVHRDVKPENLFVVRRTAGDEMVKVLDYGVAKFLGHLADNFATRTGHPIGTLAYMPPEQARGESGVNERADVYGLGAVLFEALTGRPPHVGKEPHELLYRILYERCPLVRSIAGHVPQELEAVVDRALQQRPEKRFSSVAELAEALLPFASCVGDRRNERTAPSPHVREESFASTEPEHPRARRPRRIARVSILGAFLVIVSGVCYSIALPEDGRAEGDEPSNPHRRASAASNLGPGEVLVPSSRKQAEMPASRLGPSRGLVPTGASRTRGAPTTDPVDESSAGLTTAAGKQESVPELAHRKPLPTRVVRPFRSNAAPSRGDTDGRVSNRNQEASTEQLDVAFSPLASFETTCPYE